ncbi:cation transporter [Nocardia nova]|uniref:cation transporter n=1 Tax=Nocardia nova TaxID=37330 RepID=UPI00379FC329
MRALVFSMWSSVVFVVVSLAWGLAAGSQMIVFDGLYSLVGIALSAVSVAAQRTVAKGADASYPWGRETWEPVVIVVRSSSVPVLRNAPSNPSTPSAPISTPSSTPGTTTTRRRWCSPRIATGWSGQ